MLIYPWHEFTAALVMVAPLIAEKATKISAQCPFSDKVCVKCKKLASLLFSEFCWPIRRPQRTKQNRWWQTPMNVGTELFVFFLLLQYKPSPCLSHGSMSGDICVCIIHNNLHNNYLKWSSLLTYWISKLNIYLAFLWLLIKRITVWASGASVVKIKV